MEVETPKFCKNSEGIGFTSVCDTATPKKKVKSKKFSLLGSHNFETKQKMKKSKFIKEYEEKNKKKKRHHSELLKMNKYQIQNINEFIQKHKFRIRNDFDKKNSEKFLLSKEQAFENPFIYYN